MARRFGPFGLRSQILLWSLLPTLIILVAVGYFSFWAYSRVTEALLEDRNRELTRLLAGQMSLELGEYVNTLGDLRDARFGDYGARRSWEQVLFEAEPGLRDFDGGVVVLDAKGVVIAANERRHSALGEDWSGHGYYRRLLASPAPLALSDVVPHLLSGDRMVGVAIAILDRRGGLSEAVIGLFSVSAHASSPFYRGLLRLSLRESALMLVDSTGVTIYHPSSELIGRSMLQEPAVQAALSGEVGASLITNIEGEPVIASYAPIPGTTCYVIEQEDWLALAAVALRYGRWLLLILGLALLVPAIVVRTALGRITQPLRSLTAAANAMSRGEMHQIVDRPSARELNDLATAFNRMASQVQGLYANLESRVRARTRELVAMNAIANVVSASLDLHEILDAALQKVLELLVMDGGSAFRLSSSGEMLVLMARRGRAAEGLPNVRHVPLATLTTREALARGAVVIAVEDLPNSELGRHARDEGWRQIVLIPLVSKDELLGLITLLSYTPRRIAHSELALLTAIGNQIGVAVENARLYQEAGRLAAMAERNRLAQDLHDSVTQTIFTTSLLAGVIPLLWDKDPEDARRQLDEVARLTRGALEEMRALLLELRPAAMAQVPLDELLRRLANSTESNARIPVHLDVEAGQALPARVRVALYRIAQEALNNVVKHASASQVWLALQPLCEEGQAATEDGPEPCGVVLAIRDDGLGFDVSAVRAGHLGLAIMQERAQDIGARLELTSTPGEGTQVRVAWMRTVAGVLHGAGLGEGGLDEESDLAALPMRGPWRITEEEGEGALDGDAEGIYGEGYYG